jgi:hypothetical protein
LGSECTIVLEPSTNNSINKPFDRIAKEFAEEAPHLFLQILGMVMPGEEVQLEPLRSETAPPMLMPDYVAALRLPDQEPCTFHVEFFVRYRDAAGRRLRVMAGAWLGNMAVA